MAMTGEEALAQALERFSLGVLVLTPDGCIEAMNSAARQLIEARRGLTASDGHLRALTAGSQRALLQLIEDAAGNRPGASGSGVLRLRDAEGDVPLDLVAVPSCETASAASRQRVVLYVIDPTGPAAGTADSFAEHHGLSRAEARVAALIARGCSAVAVANELELSYNTIKTHLARIYTKTGANRQGELIRMISCFLERDSQSRREILSNHEAG